MHPPPPSLSLGRGPPKGGAGVLALSARPAQVSSSPPLVFSGDDGQVRGGEAAAAAAAGGAFSQTFQRGAARLQGVGAASAAGLVATDACTSDPLLFFLGDRTLCGLFLEANGR